MFFTILKKNIMWKLPPLKFTKTKTDQTTMPVV